MSEDDSETPLAQDVLEAVDATFRRLEWQIPAIGARPAIVRQLLEHLARTSFQAARAHALQTIYSTQQTAQELGVTTARVRQMARRRHIGRQIDAQVWVFLPEDVEALRALRGTPIHPRDGREEDDDLDDRLAPDDTA